VLQLAYKHTLTIFNPVQLLSNISHPVFITTQTYENYWIKESGVTKNTVKTRVSFMHGKLVPGLPKALYSYLLKIMCM
jgi:hypothetical protein